MRTFTHRFAPLPALVAVVLTTGCSSTDDDEKPSVPSPAPQAAALCRALHDQLPNSVDGQRRATPTPETEYVAEWGDPVIRLRCGVPRPAVLTPGSEEYNPTADAVEVNGVSWLAEERPDGYRFTTTGRKAWVELTVPDDYAPEVNPLTDLAGPVRATVPEQPL